ncbi:MAG TPA: hypothetical protein VJ825_12380 [Gemmatimonadaceae bacterium]|nr:hypothetical protein [Gemmatimonadaceae bacterium]
MNAKIDAPSLRLPGTLLLVGQVLYIIVTQFHADGPANNHPVVFAEYASSGMWTAVHLGQFLSMSILLGGVFGLALSLDAHNPVARMASRFGAALAVVALALYGALQAVDGVANKQADVAWMSAAGAEKAARFASAEAIRWIEWGLRSYQDVAMGLALLLITAAVVRTTWLPRALGYLIGLSGIVYIVQGWVVGVQGFSSSESILIVLAWALTLAWVIWLMTVARRAHQPETSSSL